MNSSNDVRKNEEGLLFRAQYSGSKIKNMPKPYENHDHRSSRATYTSSGSRKGRSEPWGYFDKQSLHGVNNLETASQASTAALTSNNLSLHQRRSTLAGARDGSDSEARMGAALRSLGIDSRDMKIEKMVERYNGMAPMEKFFAEGQMRQVDKCNSKRG